MKKEVDCLTIEIPKEGLTAEAITNLEKLICSKSTLIKKALGTDDLKIQQTDSTLCFPWFPFNSSSEEIEASTRFICALAKTAKEQKRILAREKPVNNEKYAFRCFLLRLGFIGEEYKAARKLLLSRLTGNTALKSYGEVANNE
jgi:hypothetical protein